MTKLMRQLAFLVPLLLLPLWAGAQSVTITGTVLSPTGQPYSGGSGRAVLVSGNGSGTAYWTIGGTNPVRTPVVISGLDSAGKFSITLTNTALIDQQTLQPEWQFSFCSISYPPQICFTMTPLATTSNQDISVQIQAQSLPLPGQGSSTPGSPLNSVQVNVAGTFGGYSQLTYTLNGGLNANIVNNVLNPTLFAGSDLGAQINSAKASALCTAGCTMQIPPGNFTWSTPVTDSTGIRLLGSGMGQTIITAATASPLLTFAGVPIPGFGIEDMDFAMGGNLGGSVAQFITSGNYYNVQNVNVSYLSGATCAGTGDAFYSDGIGEGHFFNVNIVCPGRGIHVFGNSGFEFAADWVNVLSPGVSGFEADPTTATDIGGFYLTNYKVTNPYNRVMTGSLGTCGQFVFNGSGAGGGDVRSPVFFKGVGGDHAQEASSQTCPAISIVDWDLISVDENTWAGASTADAVYVSNSIEDKFIFKYASGTLCDYHLDGTISNDTFAHTYQGGSSGSNVCGDTIGGATHTHFYGNIQNAAVPMDGTTRTKLAVGGDGSSGNYDVYNTAGSLSGTRTDLSDLQSMQGIYDASSGCTTDAHGWCQIFTWGINVSDMRWYSKTLGIASWLLDIAGSGTQISFMNQPAFNLNVSGSSNILNLGTGSFLSSNNSTHVMTLENNSIAGVTWDSSANTTVQHNLTVLGTCTGCGGGGGGSPGGSSGQLQWNNSGAFGGITNLTTDGTNPFLTVISAPGAAASGKMIAFAKAGVGICAEDASSNILCPGPGGSSPQMQYNNGGALAGIVDWTSNGTDPILTVLGSTPSNPAAGHMIPYAKAGVGICAVDSTGATYCPGAGSSPGGATGAMQWNNGGVFGGVLNFTSDGTNPLFTIVSTPAPPASGLMLAYGVAGVGICGEDSGGNTYCPGGGGGGSTNPAPQYSLPYYSAPGTLSTLSGSPGMSTDINGNFYVGNTTAGPYAVVSVTDGSYTDYLTPGNLQPFQESGAATVGTCGQTGNAGNCLTTNLFQHHEMNGTENGDLTVYLQSVAGTNTITATLGGVTGYDINAQYCFIPAVTNSSPTVTLNIDSVGASPVKAHGGATLATGELIAGHMSCLTYNGSQFEDAAGSPASAGYTWTYTAQSGSTYAVPGTDFSTSAQFGKLDTNTYASGIAAWTLGGTYNANSFSRLYNSSVDKMTITPTGANSVNGSTTNSYVLNQRDGVEIRDIGAGGLVMEAFRQPMAQCSSTNTAIPCVYVLSAQAAAVSSVTVLTPTYTMTVQICGHVLVTTAATSGTITTQFENNNGIATPGFVTLGASVTAGPGNGGENNSTSAPQCMVVTQAGGDALKVQTVFGSIVGSPIYNADWTITQLN